jgi:hypothetical protein
MQQLVDESDLRTAQSRITLMPQLVMLDLLLSVIFSLPCHPWRPARRCLRRRPSGHPRTPVRAKIADMHTSHPIPDHTKIYTGRSQVIRRTHPIFIAMTSPPAGLMLRTTSGATIMMSRHSYGSILLRSIPTGVPRGLTSISLTVKLLSRACRDPLFSVLNQ